MKHFLQMALQTSVVVQDHTVKVENVGSNYFRREPLDGNYTSTFYRNIEPDTSIQATKDIEFTLPALDGAMQYLLNETLIYARVRLVDPDGQTPDENKKIGLKNNILHSLIQECRMYINGFNVQTKYDNYPYRAYISEVFSLSSESLTGNLVNVKLQVFLVKIKF